MDKDFNEFWDAYQPDEIHFPRRRAATFRAWNERTPAARKAMLAEVKAGGRKAPNHHPTSVPHPNLVLARSEKTQKIRFFAKIFTFRGTHCLVSYYLCTRFRNQTAAN